jgi:hypothetical protein
MQFDTINVHDERGGQISAHGNDQVGEFTFNGSFNQVDSGVKIVKQYKGKHAIYYEGVLNSFAHEVNGWWGTAPGSKEGQFRLRKV